MRFLLLVFEAFWLTMTTQVAADARKIVVAVGDSAVYGEGASGRCDAIVPTPVCPEGRDWVDDLARMLDADEVNLGYRGAREATILLYAIPKIPEDAAIVIFSNGWNDKDPLVENPAYTLAGWTGEVSGNLGGLSNAAPHAKLIIATLPDPLFMPGFTIGHSIVIAPELQPKYQATVASMNSVFMKEGFPFVDFSCDATMYDPSYYAPADYYHPNDLGHLHIAQAYFSAIMGTAARGKMKQNCVPWK